jgi:hypothetical protein
MLFKLFKMFVRGAYIGHQLSWGKNTAMFFTKINIGLISALITLPLSVYVSINFFGNLFLMTAIVPIVSSCFYMFIFNKWMSDKSLYPDAELMNVSNIKREKLHSNLIYFFLSVFFVLFSWGVADVYY